MELKRSIAYTAAAPPADFDDHRLRKERRSKSLAF
ncbi:unnamed protein product [Toxocara canis]|uniref:Uncharacterized protein n=1 Tax=Toxocara canis TaxID=6265 RepID=A0A3P7F7K4_TOXCA|nr:unnamed protein product [Toxocara canis]